MLSGTEIIGRAVLSAPGHVMFSGIAALGLVYLALKRIDLSKTTPKGVVSQFASKNVGSFLLLAIILHGLWDSLPAGPIIMFFVTLFVYYRLWKILPENLQNYEIPGFVDLVIAIVSSRKPQIARTSQQANVAQTVQNKFCTNCGTKISLDEKFCKNCGTAQR
jgi:ribosomal protein S27AE